jgi:hypothetical protein
MPPSIGVDELEQHQFYIIRSALYRSATTRIGASTATTAVLASILNAIVPADGTRAATVWKRGLRYVRVFWAAVGQAAACLYPLMWGYRL